MSRKKNPPDAKRSFKRREPCSSRHMREEIQFLLSGPLSFGQKLSRQILFERKRKYVIEKVFIVLFHPRGQKSKRICSQHNTSGTLCGLIFAYDGSVGRELESLIREVYFKSWIEDGRLANNSAEIRPNINNQKQLR